MAAGSVLMPQIHDTIKGNKDVALIATRGTVLSWPCPSPGQNCKPWGAGKQAQRHEQGGADLTPSLPWGGLDEGETNFPSPLLPSKVGDLGWPQGSEKGKAGLTSSSVWERAGSVPCLGSITELTLLSGV